MHPFGQDIDARPIKKCGENLIPLSPARCSSTLSGHHEARRRPTPTARPRPLMSKSVLAASVDRPLLATRLQGDGSSRSPLPASARLALGLDVAFWRAEAAVETAHGGKHGKKSELDSLDRQLTELNEGHVPIHVMVTVAVSGIDRDEIEDLTGTVRSNAVAGSSRLAVLGGNQRRALGWVLPLCRGLDRGLGGSGSPCQWRMVSENSASCRWPKPPTSKAHPLAGNGDR